MEFFSEEKFGQYKIPESTPKQHTILLVDDEEENLRFLTELFEKDYNLITAKDGKEALEVIQDDPNPERIHLIISDQRMPNMTGVEFLNRTITILPYTIRMILTGFTDIDAIISSINEGQVYKFITKPTEPNDIVITVKRALEVYDLEIIRRQQAQLVHSEKMAGLATIVSGVAHELNNPNNVVSTGIDNLKGYLEEFKKEFFNLLKEENEEIQTFFKEKLDPVYQVMERIQRGSLKINTIVKGLRTFSRLDEEEFKEVNIVDSLKSALVFARANYQNQVEFIEDFQYRPELKCWPADLNQVFMNIMNNACQAIVYQQKQVGINRSGELKISTSKREDNLEICFQDNGCGMSKEVQDKMFEPFFTIREVGSGTGLGLAIVFGIMEKHKGKIEVHSTEGQGTSVILLLPLT